MSKKIIIIIAVIVIIIIAIVVAVSKNGNNKYEFTMVELGSISQEISETGQVRQGEEIVLRFKDSGRIQNIYVSVGQKVGLGTYLVKLESEQLSFQFQDAKASLALAKAKLDKLINGASYEEIALAEAQVSNSKKALQDARNDAVEDLDQANEDASNELDDAYLKITNAYNAVDDIQATYFFYSDSISTNVRTSESVIKQEMDKIKLLLDPIDIKTAMDHAKDSLSIVFNELDSVRANCELGSYRSSVADADRTILDNQKSYILTSKEDVSDALQNIYSTEITNQTNINTAEGNLDEYEKTLAKLVADPSSEDISLNQAEVDKAESQVGILENKLYHSILRSPVNGQVTKIEKRIGETVSATETVVTLLPSAPFEIEIDVYEEDISQVKIGDPVDILLVAFPEQELTGRVISIDPAEKIIDEVVYYEVSIDFDSVISGIKPGMTADIVIRTAFKDNVLVLSRSALIKNNGRIVVQYLQGNKVKEKEIILGLEGDSFVEVVSGVEQEEQLILP